jgi:bifunctional DNase/RNase
MNGNHVEVDARPSDAIAIALRAQAPIFVDDEVMKKASVSDKDSERVAEETVPMDRLERLNFELQKAVSEERFEDAARLRDEINTAKKDRRSEK